MNTNESPDRRIKLEIFNRLAAAYLEKAFYDNASTSSIPEETTEYIYAEGYHSVFLTRTAETLQVSMPHGFPFDCIQECWRLFCGKGMFYAYYSEHKNWIFCANLHLPVEALLKEYRSHCLNQAYASLVWYLDNMEKYGEVADPYGYHQCYGQKIGSGNDPFKIPYQPRNKLYRL